MDVEGIRRGWAGVPRVRRAVVATLVGVALATVAVGVLETVIPSLSAAPIYLLAVMSVGLLAGTIPAVVTAVASFLLYDFLFVAPFYTLTISDPDEWLNLLLLLAVAVVIGRLAALQAERAEEVAERAREAEALFAISRSLATSTEPGRGGRCRPRPSWRVSTAMDRSGWVWARRRPRSGSSRTPPAGTPLPVPGLAGRPSADARRRAGPLDPDPCRGSARRRRDAAASVYRIRVEVPGEALGSLWALRAEGERDPDRAETRILAAAADQLGQAVRRDRLVAEALEAEVARRSEALKTALLDSVSHDLRTPLATIRAAAGQHARRTSVAWTPEERTDALRSIDAEAERMNRLVRNLLDLSRIEGGALQPGPRAARPRRVRRAGRPAAVRSAEPIERRRCPTTCHPSSSTTPTSTRSSTNLVENADPLRRPTVRVDRRRAWTDGARSRSSSRTTARASPTPTGPTCSTSSTGSGGRARDRAAGWGSG